MKKLILLTIFLLSLINTPCLAQIETNSFFTLEGTLWSQGDETETIGFYENKVYICFETACAEMPVSAYTDLIICSFFVIETLGFKINGLLFPLIGVGFAVNTSTKIPYKMLKIENDWSPFTTIP